MKTKISSVAVLGGGTMGIGIAGLCADIGCKVLLLDVTLEAADKAIDRMIATKQTSFDKAELLKRITLGTLEGDLAKIADYDWICEAIIEDLATKRALFSRLEPLRRDGSVVSTNTSGIPLRAITEGMPDRLRRDIAVTHFFNPVAVMKLMELVPGEDTSAETMSSLAEFCRDGLKKGVVYAKDTVNFIGNRIGCFWMLSGLHLAKPYLAGGLSQEQIDAVVSAPMGLPSTGFYGLIDLIGLDVMDFVGKNLDVNLPANDAGRAYTRFPALEQAMLERRQLGRKTGGGYYRVTKQADGSRFKETFDLTTESWRPAQEIALDAAHASSDVIFADDAQGRFVWDLFSNTLGYAADLVPEISDDIVNVDRAMRWGFGWAKGPFELLDALDPAKVIARFEAEGRKLPAMLAVLKQAGAATFYRKDGAEYLGLDGAYHATPAE